MNTIRKSLCLGCMLLLALSAKLYRKAVPKK